MLGKLEGRVYATEALLPYYEEHGELTSFTALDGEDFHRPCPAPGAIYYP